MPFKKLQPDIKEILESLEIATPTPFQSKSIPVIKSGANIYCTAPKDSGKTTTLVLTTLHKLKCMKVGTAPRALVLVENREKVLEMYASFKKHTKYDAIRIYACDDKPHIELLKSEIFEGVDILIATPQTMNKLLLLEGVNTTELKIISIDDSEFLVEKKAHAALMAITQSIHKCQFVLYSEKMTPFLKRFESYFMVYPKTVNV